MAKSGRWQFLPCMQHSFLQGFTGKKRKESDGRVTERTRRKISKDTKKPLTNYVGFC